MSMSRNFFAQSMVQELRELSAQQKFELVGQFWPEMSVTRNTFDEFACTAYVDYIASELDQVRHYKHLFAAQTFDALFSIIRILRNNLSTPYRDLVRTLQSEFLDSSPEVIRRSVELSVRMWLTINTHTSVIFVGPISAGDMPVDWNEDLSLEQLIRSSFGKRVRLQPQSDTSKFDPTFTAAYLVNTCGMRLRWTNDINSHLSFDLNRMLLTVYRHKACLAGHLAKPEDCPVPVKVLEEVLDTLELLFPPWDTATRTLLLNERQQSLYTLGSRKSSRDYDLAHYENFGEALYHLSDSFNKTPRTWKQLAFDRRNKLEWSAFWVTVMVAVLTVVSIPCNIIQAMYSVKAYRVSVAQAASASRREL
jgi:hypothetical protein